MTDYPLTAGQQQSLTDFFNAGKAIYIEGTDFGYFQSGTAFYQMFGCTYAGDGSASNNVQTLTGQNDTLQHGVQMAYTYGSALPDQWVDYITPNGGDILFKCQSNRNRSVAYAGPAGNYRAILSTFWFGAMRNNSSTHTKAQIMAAYMSYLKGDTLVCGVANEIPASTGGDVKLFLETGPAADGRNYGVLGSKSGTSPGMPIGSVVVPLNEDNFLHYVYERWNKPLFQDFKGTLDASGRAVATLHIGGPINPSHVGTLHFAFILLKPIDQASNPVEVLIVP